MRSGSEENGDRELPFDEPALVSLLYVWWTGSLPFR